MPITNASMPSGCSGRPHSTGGTVYTVRALRRFTGQLEGHVERGCKLENVTRDRAFELAGMGVVEILEGDDNRSGFETKGGEPSSSGTSAEPASLSHQGNPPAPPTSSLSGTGPASASTTESTSGQKPTRSTVQTMDGGKSTTRKSERRAKLTDGVRTAKHAGTLISDTSNPSAPPASLGTPGVSAQASSATVAPKR